MKKLNNTHELITLLFEAQSKLITIDKKIGNDPTHYIELSKYLKKTNTTFDLKFLFQSDMELNYSKNTLNDSLVESIRKGITILNNITIPPKETTLSKFKDAFYERYQEREVPLSNVLDIEIGVGYRQNIGSGDVNPLIDNLVLPEMNDVNYTTELSWNAFHSLVQKKLIEAFKNDAYCIVFKDEDLKQFKQDWDDLPNTLSTMVELVHVDEKEKIVLFGSGSSGASNLFGRFCNGDVAMKSYTQSIIDKETSMDKEKILAEIVHLPESRVGNVLMRPAFRGYEIPYLAKSILDRDHQLSLNDLMISVKNNRIVLRSKKMKKEILPRLTNAHNYSTNSLPIYHFLADLQTQGLRSGIQFDIGPLSNDYEFIPRIEYENLILQKATWNIKKRDVDILIKTMNDDLKLKSKLKSFLTKRKIPNYAMLVDGDNELLINFNNLTSTRMLLDIVKKREQFKMTEFLFDKNSIVRGKEGYYTNQIILSFYKQKEIL